MTRIDALSIELQTSGKDKLAEEYGKVIENIQEITLASRLKNSDLITCSYPKYDKFNYAKIVKFLLLCIFLQKITYQYD